jgi:hypothetical protein
MFKFNYIDYLLAFIAIVFVNTINSNFNIYFKLYIWTIAFTDVFTRMLLYIFGLTYNYLDFTFVITNGDLELSIDNRLYNWRIYCLVVATVKLLFELYSTLVVLTNYYNIRYGGFEEFMVLIIWTFCLYKNIRIYIDLNLK